MKLIYVFVFALFVSATSTFAQEQSFIDIMSVNLRNMGSIIEQGQVMGYYMFYEVDKKDRKTRNYRLQFLDTKLNEIGSKKITGSRYLTLEEGTYNGENVMLKFIDRKEQLYFFHQYDKSGQLISKKTMEYNPRDMMRSQQNARSGSNDENDSSNASVLAIPNQGFAFLSFKKNKKLGYVINFFSDTKGERGWTFKSNPNSKEVEYATYLGANEDVLLLSVMKKPGMISKTVTNNLLAIDVKTGKKLFEKPMADSRQNVLFTNSYFDKELNEITLLGTYFAKENKVAKGDSKGMAIFTYDQNGEVKNKKYISWAKDVSKHLSVDERGRMKKTGFLFFHKIMKTDDGKMFAIAEQFKKAADGAGIALSVLARGDVGVTKAVIEDLVIFELDSELEIQDVTIYDKNKSNASLPAGAYMINSHMIGLFLKEYKAYDYAFTSNGKDQSTFSIVYQDWNRKEKELELHAVSYVDGAFTKDFIPLASDSKYHTIMQAKPGEVLIVEYFRKAKRLDLRLEKINL